MSLAEELPRLKKLRADGSLTEAGFERAVSALLELDQAKSVMLEESDEGLGQALITGPAFRLALIYAGLIVCGYVAFQFLYPSG